MDNRPDKHLAYLDGMRGLCALFVLIHHSWLTIWPIFIRDHHPSGIMALLTGWMLYGHFAVVVFIVLSGFCLTLPLVRTDAGLDTWRFFRKRIRRILPPYYAAMLFSIVLGLTLVSRKTGTHWDFSVPFTTADVLRHALLIQDWTRRTGPINHVFWSIAVEWHIYFAFPLLVLLWRRSHMLAVLAASLAVAAGAHFFVPYAHFLVLFTLGMAGAERSFSARSVHLELWSAAAIACWSLLVLTAAKKGFPWMNAHFLPMDMLVGIGTLALLVVMSRSKDNIVRRGFEMKGLVWVGLFSYSLYLVHAPLIQLFWQIAVRPFGRNDTLGLVLLLLVGCPLIVGFSYLFFLGCERPFLSSKPAKQTPA